MEEVMGTRVRGPTRTRTGSSAYAGYKVLHWAFIAAPAIAGIDKFTHLLTNWDQYLAPQVIARLPFSGHIFMLLVGVIEMFAAFLVAVKPSVGAWIVAAWLGGVIVNLVMLGGYLDIALRDFGLMLSAIALGIMSFSFDRRPRVA
jgi:hypothetical protein